MKTKTLFLSTLCILAPVFIIASCDSGSSGGTNETVPVVTSVGVFVDAPVAGLTYTSNSTSGTTNAAGEFNYVKDEEIIFSFGQVQLGGAKGKGVITPMDLMSADHDSEVVQAMASFLQSLDKDGDHSNGVQLNSQVASLLNGQLGSGNVDFTQILQLTGDNDPATSDPVSDALGDLDGVVQAVVTEASTTLGVEYDLTYIDYTTATENLVAVVEDSWIFRKNISKTQELTSSKSKFNIMPVWVPARHSDDTYWVDDASLVIIDNTPTEPASGDEFCRVTMNDKEAIIGRYENTQCWSKPLVATFTDIDWRHTDAAVDAFGAISRDDGLTWKRANLSRTGDRDVTPPINNADGFPTGFKGASRKPITQVKNNFILVAWTDYYCSGGKPTYSLTVDPADPNSDRIYDDFYGVAGSQGFVDYTEQLPADDPRMPSPSVVPYSCVWSSRGVVDAATGDIQWFLPERISSGRRDAYQIFVGAAAGGGFGITWQEDPEGLQAGSAMGPGDGLSGATASHKTDIWYNYITWGNFDDIDTDFVPKADDPDPTIPDGDVDGLGRVKALNQMTMPVRITDNAACNAKNMFSDGHQWCLLADPNENGEIVYLDPVTKSELELNVIAGTDPENLDRLAVIDLSDLHLINCDRLIDLGPVDETLGYTCLTQNGAVLDGDTGASRPNLFLQKDIEGKTWAILAYEETKGRNEIFFDGVQALEDLGKNSRYHSFAFNKPDEIAQGEYVNMPELYNDLPVVRWCVDDLGALHERADLTSCPASTTPVYARENARRIRFALQGEKAVKSSGTVLVTFYKQGMEGKGAPSDIMMRRMVLGDDAATGGNPYAYKNFVCEAADVYGNCYKGAKNMSSTTTDAYELPTQLEPIGDTLTLCPKLTAWHWSADNFADTTSTTICDDSRAHRGQLRGDFLAMGYTWTPNWAPARNGNDKYDFFIRRSFDGGQTFTTKGDVEHLSYFDPDPTVSGDQYLVSTTILAGKFEPPRNVSLLRNNFESVIEPRIVAVPGSITLKGDANSDAKPDLCTADKKPCFPAEDKANYKVFIASYGLANNSDENDDGDLDSYPTDMYFAKSEDEGESYLTVSKCTVDGIAVDGEDCIDVWPWLTKRSGIEEGEAQIRVTPAGDRAYATWLQESAYDPSDHFSGSDIWFRKIDKDSYSWGPPAAVEDSEGGDL